MLVEREPYGLNAAEKQPLLLSELNQLTEHHQQHCQPYQQLIKAQWPAVIAAKHSAQNTEQLPYLAVRLFKQLKLQSVPDAEVFKVLYSSGTTGTPSRIVLDSTTAAMQSKILVKIMQHWLGKARLPMLIIDHPGVIKDRSNFSARGAGIQGLSFMGRNHCYALNDDMSINVEAVEQFCQQFGDGPVFVFGFTFMVWQFFIQELHKQNKTISLPQAVLLHSGGWKKLQDQAVDNSTFKQQVLALTGISKVHNFYGMVEQVGAIFVECEQGHLHCPSYADVLVRTPGSWQPAAVGEEGVLQLLSTLPRSYPGHSLLSEDRAVLLGEDNCPCGRMGKYFHILGRLPAAEARGCSDTFSPSTKEGAAV
jgi:phenylacetate-coenzyme A ligase PaaK-like adenylate-forming protein